MNMEKEALEMYLKELIKLKSKAEAKLDKEIVKHNSKLNKIIEEYSSVNDIEEAYGCGIITESKREKLLNLFENLDKAKEHRSATGLYLKMLENDIKNIKREISFTSK